MARCVLRNKFRFLSVIYDIAPINYKSYDLANVDVRIRNVIGSQSDDAKSVDINDLYLTIRFVGLYRTCLSITYDNCQSCNLPRVSNTSKPWTCDCGLKARTYHAKLLYILYTYICIILLTFYFKYEVVSSLNGTNIPLPWCSIQDNCTRFSIGVSVTWSAANLPSELMTTRVN